MALLSSRPVPPHARVVFLCEWHLSLGWPRDSASFVRLAQLAHDGADLSELSGLSRDDAEFVRDLQSRREKNDDFLVSLHYGDGTCSYPRGSLSHILRCKDWPAAA